MLPLRHFLRLQQRRDHRWIQRSGQAFLTHVSPREVPFLSLFRDQGTDQSDNCRVIREDPDDVGPALELLVHPLQRVSACDLSSVLFRESHEGQDVGFGGSHEIGQLARA